MGEWLQNVGVAAPLPKSVSALAAPEGMWLPEPPAAGWNWATLDDVLDDGDSEKLIVSAARGTRSPALTFSLFDGDSALLLAASPHGVESRLVFDPERFDSWFAGADRTAAEVSRGGAKRFAAWSASYAPVAVAASAVNDFCRSPDPVPLLAAVGLYPERKRKTTPDWENWFPSDMRGAGPRGWDGRGTSHLIGSREFAILPEPSDGFEGPPGPWIMLLGHDVSEGISASPVQTWLTFMSRDRVYTLEGWFESADQAKRHFGVTYTGRTIGRWQHVPDDVGRTLAQTVAWLLTQSDSSP